MHPFTLPEDRIAFVTRRSGRPHPFDRLDPETTALLVVDMQHYFMGPGYLGEVPMARAIVPQVNRLAASLRRLGGTVVWIKNTTTATEESWSVHHQHLLTPENSQRRLETQDLSHEGHSLWPELDVQAGDLILPKTRFSAFIAGSSDLEARLRGRGIDTVLVAGTATHICCESTARDAMMLNFKTVMVSDACAANSDQEHANALGAFYGMFGDVQTTDEAIASLEPDPIRFDQPDR